jgi:hypothetical protein
MAELIVLGAHLLEFEEVFGCADMSGFEFVAVSTIVDDDGVEEVVVVAVDES